MVYNHMYMPVDYGRDPRFEYEAMTQRVTLWDVGAERQTELRGPSAEARRSPVGARADKNEVGGCRYTMICDDRGQILTEPIVLHPFPDTVWISHGDVDLELWARGVALCGEFDVTVVEPDVAPMQIHGPRRRGADRIRRRRGRRACVLPVLRDRGVRGARGGVEHGMES